MKEDYMKAFRECNFEHKEYNKPAVDKGSHYDGCPMPDENDTLVARLRNIAGDGTREKNLLEAYRHQHPLLESVISKETTFEQAYKPITKCYQGIRQFLPKPWLTREKRCFVMENMELAHDYGLSSKKGAASMPASYQLYTAAAISFLGYTSYTHNFPLGVLASMASPVVAIWAATKTVRLLRSNSRANRRLKSDLKYLDDAVRKAYK